MQNLFTTKSENVNQNFLKDMLSSHPYKRAGMHLLLIHCKTTSPEAVLPIVPLPGIFG